MAIKGSFGSSIINSKWFQRMASDKGQIAAERFSRSAKNFMMQDVIPKQAKKDLNTILASGISNTAAKQFSGLDLEAQKALLDNFEERIGKLRNFDNNNYDAILRKVFNDAKFENVTGDDIKALKFRKKSDGTNENLVADYKKRITDAIADPSSIESDIGFGDYDLRNLEGFRHYGDLAFSYFSGYNGKDVQRTRIATAIGGYAALNAGGRLLTGGSLTRNSSGQRDIAGIPFF